MHQRRRAFDKAIWRRWRKFNHFVQRLQLIFLLNFSDPINVVFAKHLDAANHKKISLLARITVMPYCMTISYQQSQAIHQLPIGKFCSTSSLLTLLTNILLF